MENHTYRISLIQHYDTYSCIGDIRRGIGPSIAQKVIVEFGSVEAMEKYRVQHKINNLKKLSKFSYINTNILKGIEGVPLKVYRKKLSKLRKVGIEIKPYSKMSKQEMHNYLEEMRKGWGKEINDLEYTCHFDELDLDETDSNLLHVD